jgi:hypothetical protein
MTEPYTAKVYCGTTELALQSGADLEKLYLWMLAYADAKNSGDIHGEIIDNHSHQTIRQFKKRAIE